ncbi:hypothetical protein GBA52_017543 [Prunus armeniaca]|nr:hypothetical protein GBA52_017543 [Prunus armeniaca]
MSLGFRRVYGCDGWIASPFLKRRKASHQDSVHQATPLGNLPPSLGHHPTWTSSHTWHKIHGPD